MSRARPAAFAPPAPELLALAAGNAVLHVVGLALAAAGIEPGTARHPLAERMAYVATAPPAWLAAWGTWMLCALALFLFAAVLERRLTGATGAATALVAAGAAVDLLAETVWLAVLPEVAARGDQATYLALERVAVAGGAVVANGLYSLAVLWLSRELRRRRGGSLAAWLGLAVAVAGFLLVAAGFHGEPRHLAWTTGLTIGLFCVWVFAAARAAATPDPAEAS